MPRETPAALLPSSSPVRFVDEHGLRVDEHDGYSEPPADRLVEAYRLMVLGRRFDVQATALTKQGRLAVYPSSAGQEACQVASALALAETDWLFPTYRDSVALVARGLEPDEVLTLLRGDAHCGYDPAVTRVAPQCTPLATQSLHATGLAHALQRRGEDAVALALLGDGATSEGDFHEALNFAAVFNAPVVFFVQNNGYAISVPFEKQSAAPALAYKGVGYGVRSEQVDGNDAVAVLAVLDAAVAHARASRGPVLVEAHTYRIDAHTNADDATRYRDPAEVEKWRAADPLSRLKTYLTSRKLVFPKDIERFHADAETFAAGVRDTLNADVEPDPLSLFEHVYAEPTRHLTAQRAQVAAELEALEA